jgi:hypothetical protein
VVTMVQISTPPNRRCWQPTARRRAASFRARSSVGKRDAVSRRSSAVSRRLCGAHTSAIADRHACETNTIVGVSRLPRSAAGELGGTHISEDTDAACSVPLAPGGRMRLAVGRGTQRGGPLARGAGRSVSRTIGVER